MSHSDDLDWLARNVHVWPDGKIECIPMQPYKVCNVVWSSSNPCEGWITKDQWLARRAELQNKPNWDYAPEWAEWLAQDADGEWGWYEAKPIKQGSTFYSEDCGHARYGEALGDWRDTLEKRPDINKNSDKMDASAERVQKTAESMHDWHERGELPPVGAKVQWRPGSIGQWEHDSWIDVDVIAHAGDGDIVIKWDGQAGNNKQLVTASQETFRPIRTGRDEAIEAMKAHCPYPGSWETTYRLFAEALYDAGYLKQSDAILAAGFRC